MYVCMCVFVYGCELDLCKRNNVGKVSNIMNSHESRKVIDSEAKIAVAALVVAAAAAAAAFAGLLFLVPVVAVVACHQHHHDHHHNLLATLACIPSNTERTTMLLQHEQQ